MKTETKKCGISDVKRQCTIKVRKKYKIDGWID
jgi:hypothetical protein